ncbi:hypothetical protein SK128_024667 [Halocaridina rubra]|uniref:MHD1 domain-containing protein n=1 Tax=Halocaridina rubra TaxID=373956 RepID=A0AAN9AD65_HALRR
MENITKEEEAVLENVALVLCYGHFPSPNGNAISKSTKAEDTCSGTYSVTEEPKSHLINEIKTVSENLNLHPQIIISEPKASNRLFYNGSFNGTRNKVPTEDDTDRADKTNHCAALQDKVMKRAQLNVKQNSNSFEDVIHNSNPFEDVIHHSNPFEDVINHSNPFEEDPDATSEISNHEFHQETKKSLSLHPKDDKNPFDDDGHVMDEKDSKDDYQLHAVNFKGQKNSNKNLGELEKQASKDLSPHKNPFEEDKDTVDNCSPSKAHNQPFKQISEGNAKEYYNSFRGDKNNCSDCIQSKSHHVKDTESLNYGSRNRNISLEKEMKSKEKLGHCKADCEVHQEIVTHKSNPNSENGFSGVNNKQHQEDGNNSLRGVDSENSFYSYKESTNKSSLANEEQADLIKDTKNSIDISNSMAKLALSGADCHLPECSFASVDKFQGSPSINSTLKFLNTIQIANQVTRAHAKELISVAFNMTHEDLNNLLQKTLEYKSAPKVELHLKDIKAEGVTEKSDKANSHKAEGSPVLFLKVKLGQQINLFNFICTSDCATIQQTIKLDVHNMYNDTLDLEAWTADNIPEEDSHSPLRLDFLGRLKTGSARRKRSDPGNVLSEDILIESKEEIQDGDTLHNKTTKDTDVREQTTKHSSDDREHSYSENKLDNSVSKSSDLSFSEDATVNISSDTFDSSTPREKMMNKPNKSFSKILHKSKSLDITSIKPKPKQGDLSSHNNPKDTKHSLFDDSKRTDEDISESPHTRGSKIFSSFRKSIKRKHKNVTKVEHPATSPLNSKVQSDTCDSFTEENSSKHSLDISNTTDDKIKCPENPPDIQAHLSSIGKGLLQAELLAHTTIKIKDLIGKWREEDWFPLEIVCKRLTEREHIAAQHTKGTLANHPTQEDEERERNLSRIYLHLSLANPVLETTFSPFHTYFSVYSKLAGIHVQALSSLVVYDGSVGMVGDKFLEQLKFFLTISTEHQKLTMWLATTKMRPSDSIFLHTLLIELAEYLTSEVYSTEEKELFATSTSKWVQQAISTEFENLHSAFPCHTEVIHLTRLEHFLRCFRLITSEKLRGHIPEHVSLLFLTDLLKHSLQKHVNTWINALKKEAAITPNSQMKKTGEKNEVDENIRYSAEKKALNEDAIQEKPETSNRDTYQVESKTAAPGNELTRADSTSSTNTVTRYCSILPANYQVFNSSLRHIRTSSIKLSKEIKGITNNISEEIREYVKIKSNSTVIFVNKKTPEQPDNLMPPEAGADVMKSMWYENLKRSASLSKAIADFLYLSATTYHPIFVIEMSVNYLQMIITKVFPAASHILRKIQHYNASEMYPLGENVSEAAQVAWKICSNLNEINKFGIEIKLPANDIPKEYKEMFSEVVLQWLALGKLISQKEIENDIKEDNYIAIDFDKGYSNSATSMADILQIIMSQLEKMWWPGGVKPGANTLANISEHILTLTREYTDLVIQHFSVKESKTNEVPLQVCTAVCNIQYICNETNSHLSQLMLWAEEEPQKQEEVVRYNGPRKLEEDFKRKSQELETHVKRTAKELLERCLPGLEDLLRESWICDNSDIIVTALENSLQAIENRLYFAKPVLVALWERLYECAKSEKSKNAKLKGWQEMKKLLNTIDAAYKFLTDSQGVGCELPLENIQDFERLKEDLTCLSISTPCLIARYYKERYSEQSEGESKTNGHLIANVSYVMLEITSSEHGLRVHIIQAPGNESGVLVKVRVEPEEWFPNVAPMKTRLHVGKTAVFDEVLTFTDVQMNEGKENKDSNVTEGVLVFQIRTPRTLYRSIVHQEAVIPLDNIPVVEDTNKLHTVKHIRLVLTRPRNFTGRIT